MKVRLRLLGTVTVATLFIAAAAADRSNAAVPSPDQKIQAKAGDMIVVENADRVRILRRREAHVRTIYSIEQRWLVVLADYSMAPAGPDGQVDATYRYEDVIGNWPLGARWEGRAMIDDYSLAGESGFYGIGLSTPTGLVQVVSNGVGATFRDPSAMDSLVFSRVARGDRMPSFDAAEQREISILANRFTTTMTSPGGQPGTSPVRVGGNIRAPAKLHDVRPKYPEEALAARVTGLVILEAIIGTDGSVTDTKVLKGVQLLDNAAMDAVKQWRFEPTFLNGVAVPVIMTVTVSFNLQ